MSTPTPNLDSVLSETQIQQLCHYTFLYGTLAAIAVTKTFDLTKVAMFTYNRLSAIDEASISYPFIVETTEKYIDIILKEPNLVVDGQLTPEGVIIAADYLKRLGA